MGIFRNKGLENRIKSIEDRIKSIEDNYDELSKMFEDYKRHTDRRAKLVRTNFIGNLTNEKLIEDFKNIQYIDDNSEKWIFRRQGYSFDNVSKMINDCDYRCVDAFYETLHKYEQKQILLDMFSEHNK